MEREMGCKGSGQGKDSSRGTRYSAVLTKMFCFSCISGFRFKPGLNLNQTALELNLRLGSGFALMGDFRFRSGLGFAQIGKNKTKTKPRHP